MIDLKEYEKLKEYYDFQRKKEYNREQLQDAILEWVNSILSYYKKILNDQ